MVIRQGDIIKFDFDPALGHEQKGYRPALVISNEVYNKYTNLLIVVPITNTQNRFPLHIKLDNRTKTTGTILCEHIKSIDTIAGQIIMVEELPKDILKNVLAMISGEIELLN